MKEFWVELPLGRFDEDETREEVLIPTKGSYGAYAGIFRIRKTFSWGYGGPIRDYYTGMEYWRELQVYDS